MTTSAPERGSPAGLLLAAGAGRRAGGPKALRVEQDGTSWLQRSIEVLQAGRCAPVIVVLGCAAEQARPLVREPEKVIMVEAPDWDDGLGRSLAAGLTAVQAVEPEAVVVHLVDLPDVTAAVVRRLVDALPLTGQVLARATYSGRPGHPVLIGRDHLAPILAELSGDAGARAYLDRWSVHGVECGDLATGHDQDEAEDQ